MSRWHNTGVTTSMTGLVLGPLVKARRFVEERKSLSDKQITTLLSREFPEETAEAALRLGMPLDFLVGVFRRRLNANAAESGGSTPPDYTMPDFDTPKPWNERGER